MKPLPRLNKVKLGVTRPEEEIDLRRGLTIHGIDRRRRSRLHCAMFEEKCNPPNLV